MNTNKIIAQLEAEQLKTDLPDASESERRRS